MLEDSEGDHLVKNEAEINDDLMTQTMVRIILKFLNAFGNSHKTSAIKPSSLRSKLKNWPRVMP